MFVIGIAGGTGSGKSTMAKYLKEALGEEQVLHLSQDHYYKDLSHLSAPERDKVNFDHPFSIDFDLLKAHLRQILNGTCVERPVYDFKTHTRVDSVLIAPCPVVLIEGILVFTDRDILDFMDIRVFIDTDPDIRLIRRIQRDIEQRGRTIKSILNQYIQSVRPMHFKFVDSSKKNADIVISNSDSYETLIKTVADIIKLIQDKQSEI